MDLDPQLLVALTMVAVSDAILPCPARRPQRAFQMIWLSRLDAFGAEGDEKRSFGVFERILGGGHRTLHHVAHENVRPTGHVHMKVIGETPRSNA